MVDILILSLGSNIKPERENLIRAVKGLNKKFYFSKISSLYLTEPLDDLDQDNFYNLCVRYFSKIKDPYKILKIVKNIEKRIGRKKDLNKPKGPRKIDIDIIFFGNIEMNSEKLIIPHKSLFNRKFVLEPLIEILPDDSIYFQKYNLKDHLKKVEKQKTKKIGELII